MNRLSNTFHLLIRATLLLYLFVSPLYSQPKNNKKIYFESLEAGNTKQEIINKIRNQVSLTILRYFRDKYSFTDDSVINGLLVQLKKQQKLGCDTDKCYRMIEDFLSPDEKISGILQSEGNRYSLTLKLLDVSKTGSLIEQKTVSFTPSQLEYFVMEATRSLLDSSYAINTSNAPPEFIPGKIELESIQVLEVQGIDIKIVNFKSADTRAEGILSVLREELQNGDTAFQKKDYNKALEFYENILKTIETSLTGDSKKGIQEYIAGINKRISNTQQNLVAEDLAKIDKRFSSGQYDLKTLEEFLKEYESLEKKISSSSEFKSLSLATRERAKKIESTIFGILEKEGDSYYDTYRFTEALKKYEAIKNRSMVSKNLSSQESKTLLQKIEKKLIITKETGISYYKNQVKSYCNFAEKENIRITLKRNRGEGVETNILEENIKKAESILKKNLLIDEETLEYYNSVVRILNSKNQNIANYVSRREIGIDHKESGESEDSENEFDLSSIPLEPFLFPGLGHLEKNPDSKRGAFYRNATFLSFGLISLSYLNYSENYRNYSKMNMIPTLLVTSNLGIPAGIYYSEATIKPIRAEYEQSVSFLNGSLSLLGILYLSSLIDYALTDDFKYSEGIRVRGMEYGYWNFSGERTGWRGGDPIDEKVDIYYRMKW